MSGKKAADTPPVDDSQLTSTYHTVHDLDDGPISVGVFEAVEDALGVDPTVETIPVNESIDPDGLDAVFCDDSGDAYLSFPLWEYRVVVHSDGHIFIHPETV